MESPTTQRGIGLAVTVPEDVVLSAAEAAERSGYHSFWLNNLPQSDALVPLGAAAKRATRIWLGVGVIPLSARDPGEIAGSVLRNDIPLERFYLGIGSGSGSRGLQLVEEGIAALRSRLDCTLAIAALGPKMCRLAGRKADGVLLNWLTPEFARRSAGWVRAGAEEAGRPAPRIMAYVRVALGDPAVARLREEAARYESFPAYAASFARMGKSGMETAVTGTTPAEIRRGLEEWDGAVDEVVVRAITAHDTVEGVSALLDAAGPQSS